MKSVLLALGIVSLFLFVSPTKADSPPFQYRAKYVVLSPHAGQFVAAACPTGHSVAGGGYYSPSSLVNTFASYPITLPAGQWETHVYNNADVPVPYYVFASCTG